MMLIHLPKSFFTIFFMGAVVSENAVEIMKQYVINIALVDPTVADIVKAYSSADFCKDKTQSKTPILQKSPAMFMVLGLAGITGLVLMYHWKLRWNSSLSVFTRHEYFCLLFLLIPIVAEIVIYYFVYAQYKYFSDVDLVKLMKNLRLRDDIKHLVTLWQTSSSAINTASTTDGNGTCVNNCQTW